MLSIPMKAYIMAVFCAIAGSSIISYPLSGSFDVESFAHHLVISLAYLLFATLGNIAFFYFSRQHASWRIAFSFAIIMIVTASVIYSFSRQYSVILVLPSLFCLPGASLGVFITAICSDITARKNANLVGHDDE